MKDFNDKKYTFTVTVDDEYSVHTYRIVTDGSYSVHDLIQGAAKAVDSEVLESVGSVYKL